MKIHISTLVFQVLLALFKAILDVSYVLYIVPLFGYAGFELNWDSSVYLESWLLYLLFAFFLRQALDKPSDFLLFLFFIAAFAPMLSLYGLSDQSREYTYLVIMVFTILNIFKYGPDIRVPYVKNGSALILIVSFGLILITMIKIVVSGALFKINFDLSKVYFHREEIGASLFGGLWGYIIPWTTKVFTIILLAVSLYKKKYFFVILLILFQIFLFGVTSHKSVALYPIFAIILYIFRDSKYVLSYILLSLILLLTICLLSFLLYENILLSSLITRRVFFIPAQLNYHYYEYFSINGYVFWSNSIFSSFITYPFDLPPVQLIGSHFYGLPEMNANTGFLGTSYMNFGPLGVFMFSVIIALLVKVADIFSKGGKPTWFYLSFLTVPFFGLFTSSALLTTLLTHGLGIAMIMAWFSYDKKR